MKNTFLISEIERLHHIPVKTLRYYHDIGLFIPAYVDKRNGYRYYSIEQFEHLSTIRYLKDQGIPLQEIKAHLDNKDVTSFIKLLEEQRAITEAKMEELRRIKNRFDLRIKEVTEAMSIPRPHHIVIKECPKRLLYHLRERITTESDLEYSLRKLANQYELNTDLIIGKVVLTVSKAHLQEGIYDTYDAINVILEEEPSTKHELYVLDPGLYAYSYHQGDREVSPKYYKELLTYLDKEGYEIIGDAYERIVINDYISCREADHLTEIQIPIRHI